MREIRIPGIRRVLRISWSDPAMRRDIDDEIRFHIESRTEELVRLGVSEKDARERANAEYGDVDASRRELAAVDRHRRGTERRQEIMMSFFDDVRYAARALMRRPTLLAVTTITLAIGIAANAIMFGVIDQLLLRPPAHVQAPDEVKRVWFRDMNKGDPSYGTTTVYLVTTALRQQVPAFSEVAAFGREYNYTLGRGTDAQNVKVQMVSANYFRLLGVKPILGLGFNDDHDRLPESERVAIVSYGFWQQQLGGDENAIGRYLPLQGQTFRVVGVAPRGFAGLDMRRVDIWIPIASFANVDIGPGWHDHADNWWANIVARLAPESTPELAEAQATATYRGIVREWKHQFRDSTSSVVLSSIIGTRTPQGVTRESKVSLWLMGVSAIVLLIACANVANLLVARTMERRREISVRLAMGVSRARLFRLLLTESVLLAALGSVAALGIAFAASQFVQRVLLPDIVWAESVVDARVFGFTLGVTLLCVFLAGLAPALHGVGTQVAEGLKASSRQVAGGRSSLRFGLMMTQAALSVLLLVGAGLFVKSLRNVVTRDVGMDRERVLRVTMPLERFGFDSLQIEDIYRRGSERVASLPGVENVSVLRLSVPLSSASATHFEVPGVPQQQLKGGGPYNAVVPSGFFETVGASIVRGRDFTPTDERTRSRVVIINEMLAKAYWPAQDPIGKCVIVEIKGPCSEIVGVSKTVLQFGLVNDDRAMVYAPRGHPAFAAAPPEAMLIRVGGDRETIVPMVRKELQALAPTMPFVDVRPYSDLVAGQLRQWRLGATMFTIFGVIALIIAAVGLYSVMAYWVSQRTHEIGVRMALGATRADVVRFVALQSSRAIVAGLIVGGALALFATRWISGMLYETSPRDPAVYFGAAAVLALAAAIASVIPARRSAAVDPAQAIRTE